MDAKSIKVGPGYETRISGEWVRVRVIDIETDGTVWVCRLTDIDQRKALPRTAKQVRPVKG